MIFSIAQFKQDRVLQYTNFNCIKPCECKALGLATFNILKELTILLFSIGTDAIRSNTSEVGSSPKYLW